MMGDDQNLCLELTPLHRSCSFLVLGTPRSGTSLLTGLLGCHSQIGIEYERFGDAVRSFPGTQITRLRLFKTFCDGLANEPHMRDLAVCGNKMTLDVFRHEFDWDAPQEGYAAIFEELPMRLIFIVRDGRANVWSRLMHQDADLAGACDRWNFGVDMIMSRPRDRTLLVYFEELIRQPQVVMSEVSRFLGVNFESAMLNTEAPLVPHVMRKPTFDLAKLYVPELPEGIGRIKNNLARLGYLP